MKFVPKKELIRIIKIMWFMKGMQEINEKFGRESRSKEKMTQMDSLIKEMEDPNMKRILKYFGNE